MGITNLECAWVVEGKGTYFQRIYLKFEDVICQRYDLFQWIVIISLAVVWIPQKCCLCKISSYFLFLFISADSFLEKNIIIMLVIIIIEAC